MEIGRCDRTGYQQQNKLRPIPLFVDLINLKKRKKNWPI